MNNCLKLSQHVSLYLSIKNNYQQRERELWTLYCTVTIGFCWDDVMMKFCNVLDCLFIFTEAPGNLISDFCYLDKIINYL